MSSKLSELSCLPAATIMARGLYPSGPVISNNPLLLISCPGHAVLHSDINITKTHSQLAGQCSPAISAHRWERQETLSQKTCSLWPLSTTLLSSRASESRDKKSGEGRWEWAKESFCKIEEGSTDKVC